MFRRREDISREALAALRQDLSRLPVPDPLPGFDARVHAALRAPQPGPVATVWRLARPAVTAAVLSLVVTLALLEGMSIYASGHPSAGPRMTVAYGSAASAGLSPSSRSGLSTLSADIGGYQ